MGMLDDVGGLLTTAAIVEGGTGWTLKQGRMPETPDQVVALFEAPGLPPEPTPGLTPQDIELRYPQVQVRVRAEANDYPAARSKLQEVFSFLHAKVNTIVGAATYLHFLATSDPLPLGEDALQRPELTQNFTMAREE